MAIEDFICLYTILIFILFCKFSLIIVYNLFSNFSFSYVQLNSKQVSNSVYIGFHVVHLRFNRFYLSFLFLACFE